MRYRLTQEGEDANIFAIISFEVNCVFRHAAQLVSLEFFISHCVDSQRYLLCAILDLT